MQKTMDIQQRMTSFYEQLTNLKNELADIIDFCEDECEDEDMIDAMTEALDALEDAADATREAMENI